MGAAADLKKGLTKNLANFTKQRKAEEKHTSAGRWRMSRMTEVRGMYLTEAANAVMAECYMKVSDNNQLPATARQIFYVARPLIGERTERPLRYEYFSQTLLPNFANQHGRDWDVVYDDRGHFAEPHVRQLGRSAVCRKEGFLPLFERVKLAKRFDIAIMSSKGLSVTAARILVDKICRRIPLLVLHDFDSAGIIIRDTLENDTRRYSYRSRPQIIDLGFHYRDIRGLPSEPNSSSISDERLAQAGVAR